MNEHSSASPAGNSRVTEFSFWKPEPPPTDEGRIMPVELLSLGQLERVVAKLLQVPRMARLALAPWEHMCGSQSRLLWDVDGGVLLKVKTEDTPPRPGEVLTIKALNAASERAFYRLYVQIFEQFGVLVLDERSHRFLTPREFRTRLN